MLESIVLVIYLYFKILILILIQNFPIDAHTKIGTEITVIGRNN